MKDGNKVTDKGRVDDGVNSQDLHRCQKKAVGDCKSSVEVKVKPRQRQGLRPGLHRKQGPRQNTLPFEVKSHL